jgi:hypothetical protein
MARRSRFTDRPMSPQESALMSAVSVLFGAVVRLGADPEVLRRELRQSADWAQEWGSITRAELLRQIAEYLVPSRALGCDTNGEQPRG